MGGGGPGVRGRGGGVSLPPRPVGKGHLPHLSPGTHVEVQLQEFPVTSGRAGEGVLDTSQYPQRSSELQAKVGVQEAPHPPRHLLCDLRGVRQQVLAPDTMERASILASNPSSASSLLCDLSQDPCTSLNLHFPPPVKWLTRTPQTILVVGGGQ